jgi:hypothetical protein
MLAILQQQLAHSQAQQQQQQQQQQFQLMYEASERRAREQAEESRLAREATQAHNAEVISRPTAQMEEQKATIARLADASSATPKKEDPLEYVPHLTFTMGSRKPRSLWMSRLTAASSCGHQERGLWSRS